MSSQFTGYSTLDLYQTVINDVVNGLKETFLDEDVDLDVLSSIKKDWEKKVEESCDWDKKTVRMGMVLPPAQREMQPVARILAPPAMVRQEYTSGAPVQQSSSYQRSFSGEQIQYVPQTGMTYQTLEGRQVRLVQAPGPRLVQIAQTGSPQNAPHRLLPVQTKNVAFPPLRIPSELNSVPINQFMNIPPGLNSQPLNERQKAVTLQQIRTNVAPQQQISSNVAPQQQQTGPSMPHPSMYQLDGNGDRDLEKVPAKKPSKKKAKRVLSELLRQMQLDGGRGAAGMSDSSSEDEEFDPLKRLVDKIGGDGAIDDEDEENVVEETPLNSDDDEDDADLDRLFEVENVMICQFEKIHRSRNKWKMNLKDGILRVDHRDTCFFKCSGEAEF